MKTEKVLTMMKSFKLQTAKTVSAMKAKVSMKKPSAQAKIVTKGSGGGKKPTKKQDLFTAELGLVVLGKKWFIGFKARRGDITRMKNEWAGQRASTGILSLTTDLMVFVLRRGNRIVDEFS